MNKTISYFFCDYHSRENLKMADLAKIVERREKRRAENERWIRNHIGQSRGYSYAKRHPSEGLQIFRDRRRRTNRRKKHRLLYKQL